MIKKINNYLKNYGTTSENVIILIFLLFIIAFGAGIAIFSNAIISNIPNNALPNTLIPKTPAIPGDETADWQTFQDPASTARFKYPAQFGANVWHAQFWPPQLTVVPQGQDTIALGCPDLPAGQNQPTKLTINDQSYVLYIAQDAGAGQLYSRYCYIAQKNQKSYVLYAVIWSANSCGNNECGPYCGTADEQECRALNRKTMIEQPLNKIVSTLKF